MEKAAAAAAERWRAWCSTKHRHQKLPVSLGDALDPQAQGMSPSDGMSTDSRVTSSGLAVEILDCDGWLRTGALGEDECHQEPSGRTSATRLPADATALPGERNGRTRTMGSSRALTASLAGKTRTLLSPEAFLRRVPSRGLAVLFLCRVLFLRVIFFQVAFPEPLQTGRAINSS